MHPYATRKIGLTLLAIAGAGCFATALPNAPSLDVFPGDDLQAAIDRAATLSNKVVKVHAGTYFPTEKRQAFIYLNRRHDGIKLEAVGEVILSAQNPKIADPAAESFPAVVNHVVYFGDGITRATVLSGFKITGANNFVTDGPSPEAVEPNLSFFDKTGGAYGRLFFFTDGGGIKIFGRSFPTIEKVEVYDNFSNPCGAGVSIEHRGFGGSGVLLTNCVFRNNRSFVTGSGVDILTGSSVEIKNCLFVGNISNTGTNYQIVKGNIAWPEIPSLMRTTFPYMKEHGSGALTVFKGAIAKVEHCTFTGNFNGVDDRGTRSSYTHCIFWMNNAKGGIRPEGRYELSIENGQAVGNCFVNGDIDDLWNNVSRTANQLGCPDPKFNPKYVPTNPLFKDIGYRPY